MIPSEFEYYAPQTLPDAIALLTRFGDEGKLLAGGHSLLPMMKLRLARPGHLIDLAHIAELRGIREDGATLVIGAMTTENEIIWSRLLEDRCPLLVEGARQISDPQVRYRGTLGGDICHADPGNDHPALMLALGASFALRGAGGERMVPADRFFLGAFTTAMQPDEVMTQIRIPTPPQGSGHCYAKLKRKTGDFAAAASAVQLRLAGRRVQDVRITLTNVGAAPLRATKAEELLRGQEPDARLIAEAARLAMGICSPSADQRGDAEYKTAMAGEMTVRALSTARDRAALAAR